MRKGDNFKQLFTNFFDLPRDVVLNLPRIIVIGNNQFYIENHRGVMEYSDHLIRVRITGGELQVAGSELIIRNVYQEEIIIEGQIQRVEFLD